MSVTRKRTFEQRLASFVNCRQTGLVEEFDFSSTPIAAPLKTPEDPVISKSISGTRDPLEALEQHFGFRKFLGGQEQVVRALLSGKDALVVMPTGGGKSLCYQLPAMVMDGVTIVVSPLIALMKDQVDALERKGIPATMINSTLTPGEQGERIQRLAAGEFKMVYVAPERFRSQSFLNALGRVDISLFAVDEAHCLSQWGHDFRPDYLKLHKALEALGHPQTAAFTATATPVVREDILKNLTLRDPFVSVSGFERPNLALTVSQVRGVQEKYDRLQKIVKEHKTGIVYCATRKKVEEVSDSLAVLGHSVIAYHGGLQDAERAAAQNAFIEKKADVAVATNAFGMGIDRSDVRFVVHFEVPGSLEAYYQEAGRAGRDGEASVCELLFNYADTRTQEFFIDGNNPGYGTILDVYRSLRLLANENHEVLIPIRQIADAVGLKNDMAVSSALSMLSRSGYIQRFDMAGERTRGTRLLRPEVKPEELEIDQKALDEKESRDRAKLDAVIKFAYSDDCRQAWILEYFGEPGTYECGTCDRCQSHGGSEKREPNDDEFLIVRKFLSGVARCSRKLTNGQWEGRYGKGRIVQMLTGSRSQEVLSARLDELTTYGLLKPEGSAYLYALLKEMEKGGLVTTQKSGNYPLLSLTERGSKVMQGDRSFRLLWPDRLVVNMTGGKKTKADEVAESFGLEELSFDESLFEKLRKKRAELAAAEGNKPAYVIFSDQVLQFFTRLRPKTREQGLSIRGVGEVKAEKYLDSFLEVIRAHEKS